MQYYKVHISRSTKTLLHHVEIMENIIKRDPKQKPFEKANCKPPKELCLKLIKMLQVVKALYGLAGHGDYLDCTFIFHILESLEIQTAIHYT